MTWTFFEDTPDNAQRLLDSLLAAGFGAASLTNVTDILSNEITVFQDKVRIDGQISTPGLKFQDAWGGEVTMDYHKQKFFVVSRKDLISSKRASARDVDLEDVRLLELP